MARGPFQGTYNPNARQVVSTSPDAVVYLNGEAEIIGCPECSRSFDINKYITSIQTDLNIDSAPGSGTVSLSIPRHSIDDFYFDGNPVITPMMEIEIYAKGYYLVEGVPQYYPIFWGIVTEVSDSYSSGAHTVSIHFSDILKWWELATININPAYTATSGQQGRNLTGNVYAQRNPYDIIFSLAQASFGDIIAATGSMNALIRESGQQDTFDASLSDMMAYWEKRFARIRSNLVLYGTSGVSLRGDTLFQEYSKNPTNSSNTAFASAAVMQANGNNGPFTFNPASSDAVAFKRVVGNAGQIDLWQSEYQTKLELANAAKESIGFEFYMDVTGDIVFKPPFYNLDVLGNKPVSWIQDIDIIDWDFSESESEVVTQITMQGNYGGTSDYSLSQEITPTTAVTDYHLLRKYGWRSRPYNAEFLTSPQLMFLHGLDVLDRLNSKRHRGTVTIPMRPELRLGFPIYIAPKDQVWYIQGISHSIAFGGQATTTLTLTARRSKFIAPKGMGTLKIDSFNGAPEEAGKDGERRPFRYSSGDLSTKATFSLDITNTATIPPDRNLFTNTPTPNPYDPLILRHPKTGRIVGYPNAVMVYTRPFEPNDPSSQMGQKSPALPQGQLSEADKERIRLSREAQLDHIKGKFAANQDDYLLDKYLNNRYQYGLNSAGVFTYAHDVSPGQGVISEAILVPQKNLSVTPKSITSNPVNTIFIRPVSDERGFEVIGHYQYGRRVALRDGKLISENPDDVAQIDVQLSLAGGLSEMLAAQSQGLTTISTGTTNPAVALSRLTLEDQQTSGTLEVDSPKFSAVSKTFVSTAVLGSQEQTGTPLTVEASQLSRALTLAELSVKDGTTTSSADENCICITGRADLAFMNFDYQVNTLDEKTPDLSGLFGATGDPVNAGALNQAQQSLSLSQARVSQIQDLYNDAVQNPPKETEGRVYEAYQQKVLELEQSINAAQADVVVAQKNVDDLEVQYRMDGSSALYSTRRDLVSRVDSFLTNLYRTLDEAHQEFESAIRGDLLPGSDGVSGLSPSLVNPPSELGPPFSAPGRFEVGDPKAAVASITSNAENIANSFTKFSRDAKANAERSNLTTQISQDQLSITRLRETQRQLQAQRDSHVVVIGVDIDKQLATVAGELDKLEQQLANNQAKLSNLNV